MLSPTRKKDWQNAWGISKLDISFYLNECRELLKGARIMKDNCTYFDLQELVTCYEIVANAHERLLCSLPDTREAFFMRDFTYKGLVECYSTLALYTINWPEFRL